MGKKVVGIDLNGYELYKLALSIRIFNLVQMNAFHLWRVQSMRMWIHKWNGEHFQTINKTKFSICNNNLQSCLYLSKSQSKTVLIMLCIDSTVTSSVHRNWIMLACLYVCVCVCFMPLKWHANWKSKWTREHPNYRKIYCVHYFHKCMASIAKQSNQQCAHCTHQ